MVHIAVYGKGGIGKSTISSNISYSISKKGLSVTQIGCDPKHDSTVTLIDGKEQPTVLDYLRDVPPQDRKLEDIVVDGINGIRCIEAGGPQPGIGCAGRGILSMFNELEVLGLGDRESDVTVFDVLGDVVCGGFAVPMRKENTDAIFVVTSGEFMSMYAANNILRGMLNFDASKPRVAGIILNCRGMEDEYGRVKRLSDAVKVPIVAVIPRAPEFKQASLLKKTVSEAFPDSEPAGIFSEISEIVTGIDSGDTPLYVPHPLSDQQMDDFGKGKNTGIGNYGGSRKCCNEYVVTSGMCASIGASHEGGRINDMPVIIHGPMSCGHIMSQAVERHYISDINQNPALVHNRSHPFICTNMEDSSSIFGGHENLLNALKKCKEEGYKAATVITTCVTGMIGDDIDHIIGEFQKENPDFTVLPVYADGNHTGTSNDGRDQVLDRFLTLIDTSKEPERLALNIVDATFMMYDRGSNQKWFTELIDAMGIPMGVKVIDDCTIDELRDCKMNRLNVMLRYNRQNLQFKKRLEGMGFEFLPFCLPHGYSDTIEWVGKMAEAVGREDGYRDVIESISEEYWSFVDGIRPSFEGKTFDFLINNNGEVDWMMEAITDAGAKVRNAYVLVTSGNSDRFYTKHDKEINVVEGMSYRDIINAINLDPPDMLINNSRRTVDLQCREAGTTWDSLTHHASMRYLEYLNNMLVCNSNPAWTGWRCLE